MADFNEAFQKFNDTPDHTPEYDAGDIQQNKTMAILAYISWLVLIPLFAAKDSRFARFHCNQGIVLAIAEIIVWIIFGFLGRIPLIGWLFSVIDGLFSLVCFGFAVIGILNVLNGKAKELPIVGKFRLLG